MGDQVSFSSSIENQWLMKPVDFHDGKLAFILKNLLISWRRCVRNISSMYV
jgi:hypothetical protein